MSVYGDQVLKLRKEIRSLKKQLGDETGNSDIFGEPPIGAKELAELEAEQRSLTQRLIVEEGRENIRQRAYAELEMNDASDPERPRHVPRKPQRPDNSDILLSNEQMRKLEKNV